MMSKDIPSSIAREANCFTRYLVGRSASEAICARYVEAQHTLDLDQPGSPFDHRLLKAASAHPMICAWLDTAAALLAKDSMMRKRLFVLAALLETQPEYADHFLRPPPNTVGVALQLAWVSCRTFVHFVIGAPTLLAIRCL